MSGKYTGITFANQKISPSDDAIVRRAILPDGKLTGCEITYSGSTLTMDSGHLMICGRQIRNPSSKNWAIVDATSGFARLVLTIDLTGTSTKDTFDQVRDSIEYATSENGFPDLEQSDINVSGTRYQVAVCTVSLGTGGITGVVSQLGKSESGGGANFKVVGGLAQPADPEGNTIWVRTEEKITSWAISPNAPEAPQEGMVWIPISDRGAVSLRILKKELVEIYPLPAKQYVGGEFVRKDTIIFQDGVWLSLIPSGALYWDGDECVETTNGWRLDTGRRNDSTPYVSGDGSLNTYTISLTIDKKFESIQAATKQKISLAGFSKLCCEHSGATAYLQYGSSITMDDGVGRARLPASDTPTISVLDISAETGRFYVAVQKFTSGTSFGTTTIHKVWME